MTAAKRSRTKGAAKTGAGVKAGARRPRRATRSSGGGGADLTSMPLHVPPRSTLTGGDVDADQQRAWDSGDEAVGGSVVTPDQDVVDELGRALGVEQAPDAEVRTAGEILRERDRRRWEQEA